MRYEKHTVFWGCFAALAVHVLIAAAFGYSISRLMAPSTLQFFAASVYGIFAILYAYDWYTSDSDADLIAAGKEEVTEELDEEATAPQYGAMQSKTPANGKVSWLQVRRIFA